MRCTIVLSCSLQKEHRGEVTIRCYYLLSQCCEQINKCWPFFTILLRGRGEKERIVRIADFPISFVTDCKFIIVFNEVLKISKTWICPVWKILQMLVAFFGFYLFPSQRSNHCEVNHISILECLTS